MKRTPMPPRKSPLRATKPLKRGKRLRPVNPERKGKRFMDAYHSPEYVAWIHQQPCVVMGCEGRRIEAMHIRSRAAGGDWRDIVPACADHHRESHSLGIQTFSAKYALDLPIIARCHAGVWEARMADLPASASDDAGEA